jgi:hypothetical protein
LEEKPMPAINAPRVLRHAFAPSTQEKKKVRVVFGTTLRKPS